MKFIKIITVGLCLLSISISAQEVVSNGKTYKIKGDSIFQDGIDVTETLSEEKKTFIFNKNIENIKKAKKREKALKNREKQQKKAEKKQKKLKKEKNQKEKFQKNLAKIDKDLKRTKKKLKKEKAKGLTDEDARKWEKKIEKLLEKKLKAEKKLKHS